MEISKPYNSVPVKDNCALFAPTPYFQAWAIWWCHLNFSPADPCCHGNEFWDKIDYNSAPWKTIACCFHLSLFSNSGYAMVSCNFLPWWPLLSWQLSVFIQRQNWLQAHEIVKHWNAAARLYSVAMQHILVPQNVFLVKHKTDLNCQQFSFFKSFERKRKKQKGRSDGRTDGRTE